MSTHTEYTYYIHIVYVQYTYILNLGVCRHMQFQKLACCTNGQNIHISSLVSSQVRPRHTLSTVLVNACRWQAACAQKACLLAYQQHQHLVDMWWASGSASLLHWKQHHNTDKAVYWLELRTCCMTVSCLFARAAYLLGDKERACCCVSSRPRVAARVVEGRVGV